jgi:DNA-binding MarR family transcriptional regulator
VPARAKPRTVDPDLDDAWARMMSLLVDRRDALFALLREHDLTPPHGHALQLLTDGPVRMRDMADAVSCDASYITAIVDRLEEAGLVERQASTTDRRVKEIALTRSGVRLADRINAVFEVPPPELTRLDAAQRAQFVDLMRSIVPEPRPDQHLFRPPRH